MIYRLFFVKLICQKNIIVRDNDEILLIDWGRLDRVQLDGGYIVADVLDETEL